MRAPDPDAAQLISMARAEGAARLSWDHWARTPQPGWRVPPDMRLNDCRAEGGPPVDMTVTVITRDRGPILARCLRALTKQSLDPSRYEILIVDDASTDNT